jgi:hypothetical protein
MDSSVLTDGAKKKPGWIKSDEKKGDTFDQKGWQKVRNARSRLASIYHQDKLLNGKHDKVDQMAAYTKALKAGLKEHPLSYIDRRITKINLFNAFMSITSVMVGIWQVETHWQTTEMIPAASRAVPDVYIPANYSTFASLLKWFNAVQCALLGFGVFLYYCNQLEKMKGRGFVFPTEGFYEAGLLWPFLSEFLTCIICPPPMWHTVFTWKGIGEFKTLYSSNDLLVIAMLFRMFQVLRCYLDLYGLASVNLVEIGKRYNTEVTTLLMVKVLLKRHPFKFLAFFTMSMLTFFAYGISLFERPTDLDFQYFRNCLWVAIVTWTTIGFGDVYPTTDPGRITACLCCAVALVNLSLLVMAVQDTFQMTKKEELVIFTFESRAWKREIENRAAIVLQRFWRSSSSSMDPLVPMIQRSQYEKDTGLALAMREFRITKRMQPSSVTDSAVMLRDTMMVCIGIDQRLEELFTLQGFM